MKYLYLQLLCVLTITELIFTCNDKQREVNGRCCNICPEGEFLFSLCNETNQTHCKPCPPGHFSDIPSVFDRCVKCHTCEQEYTQKCTPTTNAKCSCGIGFLCSDNLCSSCEKDKCVIGEIRKVTVVVANKLTKFQYKCEPICLDHQYYDEKKNICIPRTQCSAHGLDEVFAGNKSHNAICQSQEMQKIYMVVIAGFVLVVATVMVFLSYHLAKLIKKIKASQAVVATNGQIWPLSMEESATPENKVESFG
ncbi:hypothetical protein NQD34_003768 [Periophthalmus magnuspinnatus]|uniref:tumor necrosis factor receptor superfamily member 18 n=1 Tax=Periophthalmus magnuspinnatus TaxID=409849 RepID=UPI00145B2C17|nr:tumor necrosis factor receptor superfamily member 18 [Periophthalmus magnuspinnatus]KAJ0023869.1 hypothetical protein NQD34_003768 [Periophthalmus magnuspinnatus]